MVINYLKTKWNDQKNDIINVGLIANFGTDTKIGVALAAQ
jgi:hypothetical protein